jgi:hypothetical protein
LTIESGWDSNVFVECSLFDMYAKCGNKKMWQTNYPFFYSKSFTKMNKYNIVVIVFRFDFQGQMHSLPPLCVHEQEWGK